jgi:hypothetical protein
MGFKIDKEINDSGVIAGHWELNEIHALSFERKLAVCSYVGYVSRAAYQQGKSPIDGAYIQLQFVGDSFDNVISNGLQQSVTNALNNGAKGTPEFQGAIEQ